MSYYRYNSNAYYSTNQTRPNPKNEFWYRGFSDDDIKLLSLKDGQGEACSKTGSTGLWAAIEWIDNFYALGNKQNGWFYPEEEFNWYGWGRFYEDLYDRSRKEVPKSESKRDTVPNKDTSTST